ncbi:unnamed protein product [Clonostachys solani]|uniref:Xylanolytic transcriptional activator regulatory domain-containing protein n=1 Tax=Clonostachys solani TaxID=160281 RepID=A0A9N9W758_9HYPO|nr:unnamed protein product [Clonostachys solani]
MYMGDASNICFLQTIRGTVFDNFGPCGLVNDSLRHSMVEEPAWGTSHDDPALDFPKRPSKPTKDEVEYFLVWFKRTTECVLALFDDHKLHDNIFSWLDNPSDYSHSAVALHHLIIALGAQSCPKDFDDIAEAHFHYGRYIVLMRLVDGPSIAMVQCYALIAMYLLASSRRNAAFMYLGISVRGAYALGLHRQDVSALHDPTEYTARERLWRGLRILDNFMSASLGRPPATNETRNTRSGPHYSASNDLCWIFENILTEIYAKRNVTTDGLENISELHREWSSRFTSGLETDGILPDMRIYQQGDATLNIGLLHLKEAYYWTIMLLSRPFLVEYVTLRLKQRKAEQTNFTGSTSTSRQFSASHAILVQACIDSAIRTAKLLQPMISSSLTPKRLPYVVNSAFVAALVLGLALFSDLDDATPIIHHMEACHDVLFKFSKHDAVAKRYLFITEKLQEVCGENLKIRQKEQMESKGKMLHMIFGSIDSIGSQEHQASPGLGTSGGDASHILSPESQMSMQAESLFSETMCALVDNETETENTSDEQAWIYSMSDDFMSSDNQVADFVSPSTLWLDGDCELTVEAGDN